MYLQALYKLASAEPDYELARYALYRHEHSKQPRKARYLRKDIDSDKEISEFHKWKKTACVKTAANPILRHLSRYALPVYAPTALAGSTGVNMLTGRDKELRAALGEGATRGFFGNLAPGETPGARISTVTRDAATAAGKGFAEGIGGAARNVWQGVTKSPWTAAALGTAVAAPLLLHYMLTRKRDQEKTAGFVGNLINSAYQTPVLRTLRMMPLGLTTAAMTIPTATTAAKAYQSLDNPESLGSMLLRNPGDIAGQATDSAVKAFAENIKQYPINHPWQTAGVLGAYGVGAYALYKLLGGRKSKQKKTAGLVGKAVASMAPLGFLGWAGASTLAPTATGNAVGHAIGVGASKLDQDNLLKDTYEQSLDFDTDNIQNSIRKGIANNPAVQWIGENPGKAVAIGGGISALLYLLSRKDEPETVEQGKPA